MKKIFATIVLASLATAASAQLTGTAKYDFDRLEGGAVTLHRGTVGLKYTGAYGSVDGGAVSGQLRTDIGSITANGFEIGYSNSLKLGTITTTGRVGYSELRTSGGQLDRTSVSVEGSLPITKTVNGVVGYEYNDLRLKAFGGVAEGTAHRYTVGADVALTKTVGLRALYAISRSEGENANGLTAALTYKF